MGPKDRLNIYLSNLEGIPFEWGTHDCFTFSNGAFRAMYGVGYADDWIGRYMNGSSPMGATGLRREFKHSTLSNGLSSKLRKVEQPVFGSLVTSSQAQRWVIGASLGISIGSRAVFLSREGLIRHNIEDVESAWVLK